ncbi:MAG: hypothetical protein E6Q97_10220 [Desulfurellales bacterium]|nr:MAG: hypothetical protein E6Q97_10220 [Desulfurellales bacterium]
MTQLSASFNDTGYRAFITSEAVLVGQLVKLNSDGELELCGPGDSPLGSVAALGAGHGVAGSPVTVALLNKPGSLVVIAAGAITLGAPVYAAASGRVSSSSTGRAVGLALIAAVTAGDQIEILPLESLSAVSGGLASFTLFSDFFHYTSTEDFTSILTDSGTATVSDGAGGLLDLVPSDGSVADNDEAYIKSTAEVFLFAQNKPISFAAKVGWTEANTDDANVIVGLMSGAAANALQDGGGGPAANFSGAVFFKVDGGTTWRAMVSLGATQAEVTLSNIPAAPGAGNSQKLEIIWFSTSSTSGTAYFYIDGILVGSQAFTYTGATEMNVIVGVKNGSANNESLEVDYVFCSQVR